MTHPKPRLGFLAATAVAATRPTRPTRPSCCSCLRSRSLPLQPLLPLIAAAAVAVGAALLLSLLAVHGSPHAIVASSSSSSFATAAAAAGRLDADADSNAHANGNGEGLTAVYVHWGRMDPVLRSSILLTLSWGTDVVLLSDFAVSSPDARSFNSSSSSSSRGGGGTFRSFPIDRSGFSSFEAPFRSLIASHGKLFRDVGYNVLAELRNELRFVALLNYMDRIGADADDAVVYLDSDAALLAPADAVFPRGIDRRRRRRRADDDDGGGKSVPTGTSTSALYAGCDAVVTFGQVSARTLPLRRGPLDAFWAGTALLTRPVLRAYAGFAVDLYSDPIGRGILLDKMRSLPTINDMTTWCLFVAALGYAEARTSAELPEEIARSERLAAYRELGAGAVAGAGGGASGSGGGERRRSLRVCNAQPHGFGGRHGVVHSASSEIGLGSEHHFMVRREEGAGWEEGRAAGNDKARFFVDGDAYMRYYFDHYAVAGSDADSEPLVLPPRKIRGRSFRLLTIHRKLNPREFAFLSPEANFTGTFDEFERWDRAQKRRRKRSDGGGSFGARTGRGAIPTAWRGRMDRNESLADWRQSPRLA